MTAMRIVLLAAIALNVAAGLWAGGANWWTVVGVAAPAFSLGLNLMVARRSR